MTAQLTVTRTSALLAARKRFEVTVDGTAAGVLRRGQSTTYQVDAGDHTVQTSYAADRKSPALRVTLAEDETVTLYTAHVTERAQFLKSPTKPTDWLVLTSDAASEALRTEPPVWEERVSLVLAVVMAALILLGLFAPSGSSLKSISSVVLFVVAVLAAPLLYRRFRRNYRSPQKG